MGLLLMYIYVAKESPKNPFCKVGLHETLMLVLDS